ncbi:PspC domain-containing protein [Candidatus Nanosynbacter sp. TM7-074]|uniref:PspC domain-containing protein n=1 Tax=Candidatus Nanosynbacter sp. TM7-074 TaxID=3158573 RepID=A0AB39J6U4_9BACT
MKEITRIHLAKTAFSIEIEAKSSLEKYLNSIQKNMHAEPEAMREIEARMVEILAERGVMKEGVISVDDVLAIQKQMGESRDFADGDGPVDDDLDGDGSESKPERQLMRDTDNAIIGGVCAGVAAYFNINPLWVRLIAIVSSFATFGTAVLIYVVMWLSMPPASTASDKLRMRGKPVTLAALKKAAVEGGSVIANESRDLASKILRYSAGIIIFLMTLGVVIGLIVGGAVGLSVIDLLSGLNAQIWAWGLWISLVICGISAAVLGMMLSRSVFTWTMSRVSAFSMIIATVVISMGMASSIVFGMKASSEFIYESQYLTKRMNVEIPDADNVKTISINGAMGSVKRTNSDKLKIEAEYIELPNMKKPDVNVRREGDRLMVSIAEKCPRTIFFSGCQMFYTPIGLKIYAPAGVNVDGPAYYGTDSVDHSDA